MKKYKLCFGLILATTTIFLSGSGVLTNALNGVKKNAVSPADYKLILNVDNQATVAEVGSWNNPGSETNLATRNTKLGNPIQLKFASGNGVTQNNSGVFCQMPGSYNGWFANVGSQNKLSGITTIKITTKANSAKFVFDFSFDTDLDYAYSTSVPSGVSRTSEYTGETSYTLDLEGQYNYFRLQNVGTQACGVVSLEVSYNCYEKHTHDESLEYINHDAKPAFRGIDGNIEYKECPLCHHYFDTDLNEITLEETVEKSYFFTVKGVTTEENFAYETTSDAIITVDIQLDTPSTGMRVHFKSTSVGWQRTVCAKIYGDTFEYTQPISGKTNDGVTYIGQTTDGYYRYQFDIGKMPKEDGFVQVDMISVYQWEHSSGHLDVNTKGGTLIRGEKYTGGSSKNIDFTARNVAGLTVNVDVLFLTGNDKRINVCLGNGHDTNNYGYFALWPIVKTGYEYAGVTRTELSDGYIRYSMHLDSITKKGDAVSSINCLSFKASWSDADAYVSLAFVDNLVHKDEVVPFRGVDGHLEHYVCSTCGSYFDLNKKPATAIEIERESAFYEFDNTTFPKGSGQKIIYNIPEYKQLDFGDTFIIDFKLEQIGANSEIGFIIGDSSSAYFGKFWVDCRNNEYPRVQSTGYGAGVTSSFTTDNYLRVEVLLDKTKIASGRQTNPGDIVKFDYVEILPGVDYATCSGSLEILPMKGTTTDAIPFIAGKDRTIDFPAGSYLKKSTGIIIVDIYFEDDTSKAAVMVGNWNKYNGYYDLTKKSKTGDYDGISVSALANGFKHFVFNLSSLTKGDITDDTEDYKLIYIKGGWTTATGLIRIELQTKATSPALEDIY